MKYPNLNVHFYATKAGNEPVRHWFKSLTKSDRKLLGEDIKTVQFGWPLGMPLVRHLDGDLWEARSTLRQESPELCLFWTDQIWC